MAVNLPNSPSDGQTATAGGQTLVWDATAGVWNIQAGSGGGGASVELSDSAPSSPSSGDMWFNTTNLKMYVYYVDTDGAQWIQTTSDAAVENATPSDTAPTNPSSGDIWFDTAGLNLYVYYSDGDSNQWIQMNSEATSAPTIPSDVSDLTDSTGLLSSGGVTTVYANMTALIAATGMSSGDQALVTANNNLYIYNGSGWYKIATVNNQSPSAITGVAGAYELAIDGSPTTITAVSTDPEGFPLTWSYSTSGLGSIATITNTNNVFTITPSTVEANAGTFALTISATDGVNGAVSAAANLTLEFIVTITNSRYTTILAKATSAGDNNDIIDSSPSGVAGNHPVTVNGDAHAGTFSPYRHGGYSVSFDGVGDQLQIQSFQNVLTNSEGTIEFFVKYNSTTNLPMVFSLSSSWNIGTNSNDFFFEVTGSLIYVGTSSNYQTISATTNNNTWYHVVILKNASGITIFVNGTAINTAAAPTMHSSCYLTLGSQTQTSSTWGNYDLNGYIRDFRASSNARYSGSSITVPSEPLVSDSNTQLLICHLPYFKDGSYNSYTITPAGNPETAPIAPYDNNEYDPTVHGGSVYFDGTGDYLSINDSTCDFNLSLIHI